ncbi:SIMPL domain-containing protein [Roseivirga sp. E12]|uniref:SIMPL domain-containing protein n=1 Tax=Roseivirga sp. E12 TaxID=2819237 RepID=UPI001ABCAFAF|nr:SIMPL domain-containing protein [Roseivirga sp. E12]MBO3697175.1 SIMPL domain-containing protein [Roseivirga sp. E12]
MKRIYTIALMALMSAGLFAQEQEANTLKVQGSAQIETIPDLFQFDLRFTVTTEAQRQSVDSLEHMTNYMIKCLNKKAKISKDSLKTIGFYTNINDNRYRPETKTTYTASQTLQLKVSADKEQIIKILNVIAYTNLPVNVNTSSYFSDKAKAQSEEALINAAFDNAKRQAQMLAKAGSFEVGAVRSVDYTQGEPFQVNALARMESMALKSSEDRSFANFNLAPQTLQKSIRISYFIYRKEN